MFRKTFLFGGLLLLAGATVLVTPGSGQAQHRGGGGHFGGARGGGFHQPSFRQPNFHQPNFHQPGFRQPNFHQPGFRQGSFHHRGFHHGGGWWYPPYYGYYGDGTSYDGIYRYSPDSDYNPDTYSSDWSSPASDSGSNGSYGDVTSSDTRALITVSVPADSEIWFEGTKMTSTGSVREYQSPPLTPGNGYTYDIRARWNENGHEVTQTQQVEFTSGTHVNVHFPVQAKKAPPAPSH